VIPGERAVDQKVTYCVVTLTSDEVSNIAAEVKDLPEDFDPVSWLEGNVDNIATLAPAAVKDLVIEALDRPTPGSRCRAATRAAPCCRRHWPRLPPPRGSAWCGASSGCRRL
jgi:hypothetical protein